jgi:hypothetical protein
MDSPDNVKIAFPSANEIFPSGFSYLQAPIKNPQKLNLRNNRILWNH